MGSDFFGSTVLSNLPFLLEGLQTTIWLTILSAVISLVLGTVIGIFRVQPLKLLSGFAAIYVEFFRNTPLLIQLFFFYHALPKAGLSLSGFESAMWGLSIYTAAFVAETVRAGILAIHKGQMEAARSLGLSYIEAMRYVILPQAFSIIIPPLGNLFIALLKNTSLAATIAVADLLYQGEILESRTFRTLEVLSAVGVLYLILTMPLGWGVNVLEQRLSRHLAAQGGARRQPSPVAASVTASGGGATLVMRTAVSPLALVASGLGGLVSWLLRPVVQLIAIAVTAVQYSKYLATLLKWLLYVLVLVVLWIFFGGYLTRVFTTPEGAQAWAVFGDGSTWVFLANGVLVTLEVAVISIILSLALGTMFALARLSKFPLIHWPAVAYIEIIRALPVFLMIILVYLQASQWGAKVGVSVSEIWAVILALTVYTAAVNAEVIRAGIVSIEKGQTEAARSLGLTYWQMMRHVILPQALQRMIPPLVSQFITLLKDTSLGYYIGLLELLRRAEIIYRGMHNGVMNNNPIESFIVVAVIYFVMCYILSLGSSRIERKLSPVRPGQ